MEQSGCRWERSAAAKVLTAAGTGIAALGPRVVVSAFEQVWAILVVAAALRMQSSHHLPVAHMQTAMYS